MTSVAKTPDVVEAIKVQYEDEAELTPESKAMFGEFRQAMKINDFEAAAKIVARISEDEPHNTEFWEYRGHLLGYQIASEMDDPATSYGWKRQAILAVADGLDRNSTDVRLTRWLSLFFGMAGGGDDQNQDLFRRQIATDNELHDRLRQYINLAQTLGPDGRPCSFLVAKLLAEQAIENGERSGKYPESMSPLLLFASPAASQGKYAQMLQHEGYAGRSAAAWKQAEMLFVSLSQREIPDEGGPIRLADNEQLANRLVDLAKQFKAIHPELNERPIAEEELTGARTLENAGANADLMTLIRQLTSPNFIRELELPADDAAVMIAHEAKVCYERLQKIEWSRVIVNLDAWMISCRMEQTQEVLQFRELMRQAEEQYAAGRLDEANADRPGSRQLYARAFALLADALVQNPEWGIAHPFWPDVLESIRHAEARFGPNFVPDSIVRQSEATPFVPSIN